MATKAGGTRPGAGRKLKADKHAGAIAKAEKRIADKLPELIDNLLRLAQGVELQEFDKLGQAIIRDGEVVTYCEAPDRQANEYLINRIIGKPVDKREISGPEGGSIPVSIMSAIEQVYGIDASADRPLLTSSS